VATTVATFGHTNQLVLVKPESTLLENRESVRLISAKDLGVTVQEVGRATQITTETEAMNCDRQTEAVAPAEETASLRREMVKWFAVTARQTAWKVKEPVDATSVVVAVVTAVEQPVATVGAAIKVPKMGVFDRLGKIFEEYTAAMFE